MIWAPPSCDKCVEFADQLETLPMLGTVFLQREKLVILFRAAHHDSIMDDLRGWWMISALKQGGWPDETLRSIAELVVEIEL